EYKPVSRLARFVNIPELMQIAKQSIDVVRADDLTRKNPDTGEDEKVIKRPHRKDSAVLSPLSDGMKGLMVELRQRAEELKKKRGPAQKGDDNMLVICTDGRKGAIDLRMVDAGAEDDPHSKA